jgi:hypothetical protein
MNLSLKQKVKFLVIVVIEKLLYLGQLRKLLTYHFNMIYSVFNIYIAALLKAE